MENEKIKIYTEIGFGNSTFINTEKEYPDGHEERVLGFIKMDFEGVYLRIWFGTRVIIISTKNGFKTQIKNRKNLNNCLTNQLLINSFHSLSSITS